MTSTEPRLRIRRAPRRSVSNERGSRPCSDDGFTLIEMLIAVSVLGVVLAITAPLVSMFMRQTTEEQLTYAATNRVILASEVLSQYLHDAVAPCASPCTPYSGTPSQQSFTFYSDTNNANGPSQVTISVSGTTLNATVTAPNAGSCPPSGSGCTYTANKPKTLTTVQNLTNTSPLAYLTTTSLACNKASSSISNYQGVLGVCLSIQAQITGGQPTGYQTLAYALSPSYDWRVG